MENYVYNLESIISKVDYLRNRFDDATSQHKIDENTNNILFESKELSHQILSFRDKLYALNIVYPISKDIALFSKNYTSLARLNSLRALLHKRYEELGLDSFYIKTKFEGFMKGNLSKDQDKFGEEYWELVGLVNHVLLPSIKEEAKDLIDKIKLVLQESQI